MWFELSRYTAGVSAGNTPTPTTILDADGHVAVDLSCVKCGYNLRTLAISGLCCECGTPVLYTLHSRHVQFSPPAWLRTLIRGCVLIVVAPGASILMGFILMLFSVSSRPHAEEPLVIVPALVLLAVGVCLVTRPDPLMRRFTRRREPVRRLLVAATVGWTGCLTFAACFPGLVRNAVIGFADGVGAIFATWGVVLLLLLTRHLWNLVRRGASRGVVLTYQIVFWLVSALNGLVMLLLVYDQGLGLAPPDFIRSSCAVLFPTSLIAAFTLVILTATIIAVAHRRALILRAGNATLFDEG